MAVKNDPASAHDEFFITRVFDATPGLVFDAWTDPKHLAQWWGPHAFTNPICEMDLRPGGAYRIVMRSPDGVDYPIKGVFREIVRPSRIVMTQDVSEHPAQWHDLVNPNRPKGDNNPAGELLTTVTFEDLGGKTRLTVRTKFKSTAIRDAMLKMGMTDGWSQSLERLRDLLSTSVTADREIRMMRIFDAPRELVFQMWTDPNHIIQWWGPNGFTTTIHEMDLRPGGDWRFIMHGPDGTDYQNENVFREIAKPRRLVFDHVNAPRHQMSVTFTDWEGKTRVDVHMLFESAPELEKVQKQYRAGEGLQQTLGRLQEHLAKELKRN
jgi:uncharacterized protein YndB with AHSA1/START domain